MSCRLEFPESGKPAIDLKDGDSLSEKLTIQNSPILFGCRIGICGTCAIEVLETEKPLSPRSRDESDFLDNMAPGRDNVRLACQIRVRGNMKIRKTDV